MNLRGNLLGVYKLMSENNQEGAENALLSLLRCPGCEEPMESADGREARIARCGHVYHKEPRDCWSKMCRASDGRHGSMCLSCNKPTQ